MDMNVADFLLNCLAEEGIDVAFLVYGGAMSELAEAFTRQNKIRYVCTQHEQAAGFAAEGYAKAKGVPGVVITTSGPGGGNIVTCLQNAYYDSVPLIAITGQVASNLIRPEGSKLRQLGFQETPMVDITKPITKYAMLVNAADAKFQIGDALVHAVNGRPGPVLLDIPVDVQRANV